MTGTAPRIAGVGLNVRDVAASARFYIDRLGFVAEPGSGAVSAEASNDAGGDRRYLSLGGGLLELTRADLATVASDPRANDPWFQHFAVIVSDMPAAFARLGAHRALSSSGPVTLPASSGGVIAYKFCDPDGHPLELSEIPTGRWAALAAAPGAPLFLGVDHSAIVVADLTASINFYTSRFEFEVSARIVNQGPTQAALDGLIAPIVDIIVLEPGGSPGLHLELLCYRSPRSIHRPRRLAHDDMAAARLIVEVDDLAPFGGAERGDLARDADNSHRMTDPDGHWIELRRRD